MRIYFLLVVIFCSRVMIAQDTKVLLVHSRYDPGDTSNEYLIGYHFREGKFFKQDTILHRSRLPGGDNDGRISVGLGGEKIFQNRYLFSPIGILVDLHEKRLVWEKSNLTFEKSIGRKLYFHRCFFSSTLELYEYDLDKHTYKQILERPFEGFCFRPELAAPDYNHYIETTYEAPGKVAILIMDSTGKKKKLAITSKQQYTFSGSKVSGKMPIVWTDENHFVFPSYIVHKRKDDGKAVMPDPKPPIGKVCMAIKPDSLPCCSVELTEIDIRNGSTRFVTTINGLYEEMTDDRIFKQENGELLFRNRGADTTQYFRIDPRTGETGPYSRDNPFTMTRHNHSYADTVSIPDDVFYKGEKIGTFYMSPEEYDDSVIVVLGSKKRDGPRSLLVWSTQLREWQQLPIGRFLGVLGWITKRDGDE